MSEITNWLAYAGVVVFAISGALLGLRKNMDIVGVSFIATITGIGGGTIRDLLLGAGPVGWVVDPTDIILCVVSAVVISAFNVSLLGRRMQWLIYADAIGLALFAVLGAYKAELAGAHWLVVVLFGAMSASFGGIIRDVICNEEPVLFRSEIYISAALLGAAIFVVLPESLGFNIRAISGAGAALLLRLLAIRYSWSLPYPRY